MKKLLAIFSLLVCLILTYSYMTSYRSAFEADQACHYAKQIFYSELQTDCDHDHETKQWILYQKQQANNSAKVIKRYRY